MKAAKSEGGLSRGRKRNSFFLATNAGCSPSITYLILTSRWRKTSVNMLHFTQTCLKTLMQWDAEAFEFAHFRADFSSNHFRFQARGFRRTSQYNWHKKLLVSFSTGFTRQEMTSQCWESSWSRDRDGDQPGWTVSDIDYMDVKSKAKALSSLRKIAMVNKKIHLD